MWDEGSDKISAGSESKQSQIPNEYDAFYILLIYMSGAKDGECSLFVSAQLMYLFCEDFIAHWKQILFNMLYGRKSK